MPEQDSILISSPFSREAPPPRDGEDPAACGMYQTPGVAAGSKYRLEIFDRGWPMWWNRHRLVMDLTSTTPLTCRISDRISSSDNRISAVRKAMVTGATPSTGMFWLMVRILAPAL